MPTLRIFSLFGMAGGFLLISPKLRETTTEGLASFVTKLNHYSPWSYVGLAIGVVGLVMASMVRSSQPR